MRYRARDGAGRVRDLVPGKADLAGAVSFVADAADDRRKRLDPARAEHEVDEAEGVREGPLPFLLRHAAADAEDEARLAPLEAGERAEPRVDLLFGLVADRAGVQEDRGRRSPALPLRR